MTRDEVLREITKLQEEYPALAAVSERNMIIDHDDTTTE